MSRCLLFMYCALIFNAACAEEKKEEKPNPLLIEGAKAVIVDVNSNVTFTPHNDNRHTININNHDPEYPCVALFGNKLIDCLACQSPEGLKKNFKKLNIRAARYYLFCLTLDRYREFLRFFDEHEWQEYWNSLSQDDKPLMPATIKEQQEIVAKTYERAYYNANFGLIQYWYASSETAGTEQWWRKIKEQHYFRPHQAAALEMAHSQLKKIMFKYN
jgi:hypothetical protein